MRVPEQIRQRVREITWAKADSVGWLDLSLPEKSRVYENWVRDSEVGLVLSRYMSEDRVRVYLKDTVLKGYNLTRTSAAERPLRVAFGDAHLPLQTTFVKPHGGLTADGRLVSWGPASQWKAVLMALFERSARLGAKERVAVLFKSCGQYRDPEVRSLVEDAAARLSIEYVHWVEI